MRYIVLFCKIAGYNAKLRRLYVFARRIVIERDNYLFVIEDFCKSGLFEHADRHRRCNVVTEHYIQFCLYQITRVDLRKSRVSRKDLLCHCHAHVFCPPFMLPMLL